MRIDGAGAVAFALVLINRVHRSRNVFVVGVSSLSSSSSIYSHSDV